MLSTQRAGKDVNKAHRVPGMPGLATMPSTCLQPPRPPGCNNHTIPHNNPTAVNRTHCPAREIVLATCACWGPRATPAYASRWPVQSFCACRHMALTHTGRSSHSSTDSGRLPCSISSASPQSTAKPCSTIHWAPVGSSARPRRAGTPPRRWARGSPHAGGTAAWQCRR